MSLAKKLLAGGDITYDLDIVATAFYYDQADTDSQPDGETWAFLPAGIKAGMDILIFCAFEGQNTKNPDPAGYTWYEGHYEYAHYDVYHREADGSEQEGDKVVILCDNTNDPTKKTTHTIVLSGADWARNTNSEDSSSYSYCDYNPVTMDVTQGPARGLFLGFTTNEDGGEVRRGHSSQHYQEWWTDGTPEGGSGDNYIGDWWMRIDLTRFDNQSDPGSVPAGENQPYHGCMFNAVMIGDANPIASNNQNDTKRVYYGGSYYGCASIVIAIPEISS
jgi:hypothetical protein